MTNFQSNFNETLPISDTGMKVWLVANTEVNWTVPGTDSQKYRAKFAFNSNVDVWIAINQTATVPTSGVVEDTYMQELRPYDIYVKGGDVISIISTSTPQVGVSLLAIPG